MFIGSLGRKHKPIVRVGGLHTTQVCSVWVNVDQKLHCKHSEHM